MSKRVFLIVLDSFGIGAAADAGKFGDVGANTLGSLTKSAALHIPTLQSLGLGNIDGVTVLSPAPSPLGAYGRLQECSAGKDTTVGHWEIGGIVSEKPLPLYPKGFPANITEEFCRRTGRGVLCNLPYSGTQVIRDYGEEHLKTGKLIVYTSADSVFQIAANEAIVPVETLYEYCKIARELLQGEHSVGRVIARPFAGTCAEDFVRTPRRRDFSLVPPRNTVLDCIRKAGLDTLAVGKIYDIFAGKGITAHWATHGNTDGMAHAKELLQKDFHGLCFVNLVDFDMLYGHRRDCNGYAAALTEFDGWLGEILPLLGQEDMLMITADHGCDPCFTKTTDHTREDVPLLIYGKKIKPVSLKTRTGFCDIGKTVCDYLQVENDLAGTSFLNKILK